MSRTHSSIINVIILYSWSRVRWLMDGMSERVIWGGSWVSNGKNGYYPTTYILLRELIKWYQSLCGLMCVLEIIKHMWTTYYLRSVTTNNKQGLKKRTNIDGFQHTDLWTSRKMEWLQCMWVGGWSYMIYYCCLLCISLFRWVYLISARGNRRIIQPYRTTGKTTDIEWWRKKHTICWNISLRM